MPPAVVAAIVAGAAGLAGTGATLAAKGSDEPRYVPVDDIAADDFEKQLARKTINIQKQPNLSLRNFNQPRRLTRF